MADRVGSTSGLRFVVEVGGYSFNDDAIMECTMKFTMGEMPNGIFKLVCEKSDFKLESGSYGKFTIKNSGQKDSDDHSVPIYINEMKQEKRTETSTRVTVNWSMGMSSMMSQKTYAVTGTSVETIREIFTTFGLPYIDNLKEGGLDNTTDSQVWRFINCNFVDSLDEVTEHANVADDFLYWAYDEYALKFVISTFNISKKISPPQLLRYSKDALSSTDRSTYSDAATGAKMWMFGNESKADARGKHREEMFPNLVFMSVTNGNADVGACNGECFNMVLRSMGADNQKAAEDFGMDSPESFGDTKVIEDFPNNHHKMYGLAATIRGRKLAEYSKQMRIGLFNNLGPAVGTRVGVLTYEPTQEGGNTLPDPKYCDEYIVLSKTIIKDNQSFNGNMGNPSATQSTDYITTLVLASNTPKDSTAGMEKVKEITEKISANIKG